jgi:hypothetical protein
MVAGVGLFYGRHQDTKAQRKKKKKLGAFVAIVAKKHDSAIETFFR